MGGSALPPLPPHAYLKNCESRKILGIFITYKFPGIIATFGGKRASPLTPPCPFREMPIQESDWEFVCNKNSPE